MLAQAQVVTGPYVSIGAGTLYQQNQHATYSYDDVPLAGFTAKYSWGAVGQISGGYGFGNGFRAELEGTYLFNKLRGVSPDYNSGYNGAEYGGSAQKSGAFVNVLYDFNTGGNFFTPYLGLGGGFLIATDRFSTTSAAGVVSSGSGSYTGAAAQAIVGVSFPISGVPGLSVTAEYRPLEYFEEHSVSLSGGDGSGRVSYPHAVDQQFLLGLRYAFGVAPAPAPVPAPVVAPPAPAPVATPAPAPARTYLVFFDWDKSDLTDKARAIIADAAQASSRVQITRIEVNGYTDLSGTPAYNQGLSVRRAKAVAAELVRLGVPRSEIDIMGYGESDPLVPTAPGVREPQNRRVEIILK